MCFGTQCRSSSMYGGTEVDRALCVMNACSVTDETITVIRHVDFSFHHHHAEMAADCSMAAGPEKLKARVHTTLAQATNWTKTISCKH